jgi:hypothetical protein
MLHLGRNTADDSLRAVECVLEICPLTILGSLVCRPQQSEAVMA